MSRENLLLGVILFLIALIAVLSFKMYHKRRNEIIKLLIKRDALPPPANGTTWVQDGPCFMKNGQTGKVSGNDCIMLNVL